MSYTNLLYHIVFGTKGRLPMITPDIKPRFHQYLGGTVRGLGGTALEINGTEDHVHLLVKLKPTVRFSDFLRDLKSAVDINDALSAKARVSTPARSLDSRQNKGGLFSAESTTPVARRRVVAPQHSWQMPQVYEE